MQANGGAATVVIAGYIAIDEINLSGGFIETHLIVKGGFRRGEGDSTPFDIEDAIGRRAAYRSKDTATSAIGSLVVPMRHDRVVERRKRQWTDVGPLYVGAGELQITIRTYVGASEWCSVVVEGERDSNECRAIVGRVAYVGRSRNDYSSRRCRECVADSLSRDVYWNHVTITHGQGSGYGCAARKITCDAYPERSTISTGTANANSPEILGGV